MTTTVTADIEVDVPIAVAYDQWTQFESFPEFMHGVEEVRQEGDTLTHWTVSIGGVRREFDARITDQVPEEHVAWRSLDEVTHRGRVAFRSEGAERTRVDLELEWEPESLVEKAGAALQIDDLQVRRDLERFKTFVEDRGGATGAWRGEVHGGVETRGDEASTRVTGAVPPTGDGALGSDPDLRA
ncbi:cyclase [Agromyces sp. CFH 90414]|uniref:Cyclase n=1 Tax=Agromyces agglutinans TaxID=2662258 RepID=A0A6I2F4X5_9MICO|nr:SRPBCC family protein [Agromyces agglutinans]MRG59682.1 cyclase [Agromyces agglutinans]